MRTSATMTDVDIAQGGTPMGDIALLCTSFPSACGALKHLGAFILGNDAPHIGEHLGLGGSVRGWRRHDMEGHPSGVQLVRQEKLMRQFPGQPVHVVHDDGLHQALLHEVTDPRELWAVEGCAGIVFDKDMSVWDGIELQMSKEL